MCRARVASSLIFLGLAVIVFVVTFGIMANLSAAILGAFFDVMDDVVDSLNIEGEWLATYNEISETSGYLILMIFSLGIVIFVIKVIMVAAARGAD